MRHIIISLALSFAALLSALIVVVWQSSHTPSAPAPADFVGKPMGTPVSTKSLPSMQLPTQVSEITPTATKTSSAAPTEEPITLQDIEIGVTVVAEGKLVEGAMVAAEVVEMSMTGEREAIRIFSSIAVKPKTSVGGVGNAHLSYQVSTVPDARCGVAAFHPEFGTGYAEYSLNDLMSGTANVEVRLEKGQSLEGKIVNEAGEPVPDVWVRFYGSNPEGGISLSGLSVVTNADGTFMLPGIRFDNVPATIAANLVDTRRPPRFRKKGRFVKAVIGPNALQESTLTWQVGAVVLPELTEE